jgi:hypothetical protein
MTGHVHQQLYYQKNNYTCKQKMHQVKPISIVSEKQVIKQHRHQPCQDKTELNLADSCFFCKTKPKQPIHKQDSVKPQINDVADVVGCACVMVG